MKRGLIFGMLLTAGMMAHAGELDGALSLNRVGGASMDGVSKEAEYAFGARLGWEFTQWRGWRWRAAGTYQHPVRDGGLMTLSQVRPGIQQWANGLGLEAGRRLSLEFGGGLEYRVDHLKAEEWPLLDLPAAEAQLRRVWVKAYCAYAPEGPGHFHPMVRAELGFTPQRTRSTGIEYHDTAAQAKALAPNSTFTLIFGVRFR